MASTFAGCGSNDTPLVIATTWPRVDRDHVELLLRQSGDRGPVDWVILAPGEKLERAAERRGGVDLLFGGPMFAYRRSAEQGEIAVSIFSNQSTVRAPIADRSPAARPRDPRIDPDSLAMARATLQAEGWAKGYEELVRSAGRPDSGPVSRVPLEGCEGLALVEGGPNPGRAREAIRVLSPGDLTRPSLDEINRTLADEFLADLLGAALVDSREELCEAVAALARFNHPPRAESAIGERPPWPPASFAKLMSDPNGGPMVETLLEQIAPDPDSRAWLVESWSKPKRPIDGDLLDELARAAGCKLVREPRFRGWLRGEWTAWTRQLYRRVARVAGGYVPS